MEWALSEKIPRPAVIAVSGYSGSGKTGLIERLIAGFTEEGFSVGYLKGNADRIDEDDRSKDSKRAHDAGASAVAVNVRGNGSVLAANPICERENEDHLFRCDFLNRLEEFSACDFVIAEGLKKTGFPKIVINRASNPGGVLSGRGMYNIVASLTWPELPTDWEAMEEAARAAVHRVIHSAARQASLEMDGVVLAGGESKRMGTNKAPLPLPWNRNEPKWGTMVERAYALMAMRFSQVSVVACPEASVNGAFPLLDKSVEVIRDERVDAGPLAGVEAALKRAAGRGLLAMPCDMPLFGEMALDYLMKSRDQASTATAFVKPDGLNQPLPAIFEWQGLSELSSFLDRGERKVGDFLEQADTNWVYLPEKLAYSLSNINNPDDYDALCI